MITTVTLNPCIDKTVTIDEFTYGGMNRVKSVELDAVGKGISVAAAIKSLKGEAFCTGINYIGNGQLLCENLKKMGIDFDFVTAEGDIRTNLKIFDKAKRVVTEVNEWGQSVDNTVIEEILVKVEFYAKQSDFIVFSGSVPKDVDTYIYYKMIEKANLYTKCVLDAEGNLLLNGVKAKPFFIKPNLYEIENALGIKTNSLDDVVRGAKKFINMGVGITAVSLGSDGAVITDGSSTYYAHPLKLNVRGTVGAGDSMNAGFLLALSRGLDIDDVLRYGSASASSSLLKEGTKPPDYDQFIKLLDRIKIEKL